MRCGKFVIPGQAESIPRNAGLDPGSESGVTGCKDCRLCPKLAHCPVVRIVARFVSFDNKYQ